MIGRHIFDETFRPYYGSAWFGARRHVIEGMVEGFFRPGLRDYFSRLRIAEEYLIPTLLKHLGPVQGAMNHYVHTFVEAQPGQIGQENFEQLRTSPAYFARKFADDPRRRCARGCCGNWSEPMPWQLMRCATGPLPGRRISESVSPTEPIRDLPTIASQDVSYTIWPGLGRPGPSSWPILLA